MSNGSGFSAPAGSPAPPAGGGLLQVGFDALAFGGNTLPATAGLWAPLQDGVGHTIGVSFPTLQPTSYLRIQWNTCAELSLNPGGVFAVTPQITFDGVNFFWVLPGENIFNINAVAGNYPTSGLAIVPVAPQLPLAVAVQLFYNSSSDVIMPGWLDPPSPLAGQTSLEVDEYDGAIVTQAGPPGALVPV